MKKESPHSETQTEKAILGQAVKSLLKPGENLPSGGRPRILLVSCRDHSFAKGIIPEGVEYETVPSLEVSGDASKAGLLWTDLEDELPLESSVYDVILVFDWLEYCTWPRWTLQKLHNLLKDSGRLLLLADNEATPVFQKEGKAPWKLKTGQFLKPSTDAVPETSGLHRIKKACFAPVPYPAFQLRAWLMGLGFTIDAIRHYHESGRPLGQPVFSSGGQARRRVLKWISRWRLSRPRTRLLYLCTKPGSRAEVFNQTTADDSDFFSKFNTRYAPQNDLLDQWLSRYPEFKSRRACALDLPASPKTILVLSPHPDDEIIGCGGLLLSCVQAGHRVVVLQLSAGSRCASLVNKPAPCRHHVRGEEARQVAAAAGAECVCWNLPDSQIQCTPETVERFGALCDEIRPAWIFVPFINDPHPDHRACNELLQTAVRRQRTGPAVETIWAYEVSGFVPPTDYFPVDDLFGPKEQLLLMYQSGLKPVDYVDLCLWRHAFISRRHADRVGFAECFLSLSPEEYLSLKAVPELSEKPGQ